MRYFLDTEFIEVPGDGHNDPTIDLISIGVVAEDGREYYAISSDFDDEWIHENGDGWVVDNVLSKLPDRSDPAWRSRAQIKADLLNFIGPKPEFWGYYPAYDWVVFCWLFGRMIDLPKGWPKYCRDLKQMADMCGGIKFPKQKDGEHCALDDARWNKDMYDYLRIQSQEFMDLVNHEQSSSKS
ncbi:hypothetical protein LCGC14_0430660 [marine sediment metagenome]|uniref:3'-5' exoribonuclease Rv2179c-like domain-containing protein n=1 Tax=marine sediment metagenome TaxID=412755 RepID=A0A0F9VXP8_9ZZZZ